MNTLVVWLVFLLAAGSNASEFTDFEDGMSWSCIIRTILLFENSALSLVTVRILDTNEKCKPTGNSTLQWCLDNLNNLILFS